MIRSKDGLDTMTSENVKILDRVCPICGEFYGTVIGVVPMCPFDQWTLPKETTLVTCKSCGFGFLDTVASEESYSQYYTTNNIYTNNSSLRTALATKTVLDCLPVEFMLKEWNILDVGCGGGTLLHQLIQCGYTKIAGCDITEANTEWLNESGFLGFSYDAYKPPSKEQQGKYDCVFFTAVLEHMLVPSQAIKNVSKFLKPTGFLILDIPDVIGQCTLQSPFNAIVNQEHINLFSACSLENLMHSAGMKLLTQRTGIEYGYDDFTISESSGMVAICVMDGECNDLVVDTQVEKCLRNAYLRECSINDQRRKLMRDVCLKGEPVVIFGAGSLLVQILGKSGLSECDIKYIVDNNPTLYDKTIAGYQICSPDTLRTFSGTIVIVSSAYGMNMLDQVRRMGFLGRIVCLS